VKWSEKWKANIFYKNSKLLIFFTSGITSLTLRTGRGVEKNTTSRLSEPLRGDLPIMSMFGYKVNESKVLTLKQVNNPISK
jgi:hypothetical protein